MQHTSKVPDFARRAFKGQIFDTYQWDQEMYDGSTKVFERLRRPDTVAVIPVMEDGSLIILEEEQPWQDPQLTFPTGRVEPGEAPEKAAARELLEETGLTPGSLLPLMAYSPVAKIEWTVHIFAARACVKTQGQSLDGGEKIKPKTVSFQEVLDFASAGALGADAFTAHLLRAQLDPEIMTALRADLGI